MSISLSTMSKPYLSISDTPFTYSSNVLVYGLWYSPSGLVKYHIATCSIDSTISSTALVGIVPSLNLLLLPIPTLCKNWSNVSVSGLYIWSNTHTNSLYVVISLGSWFLYAPVIELGFFISKYCVYAIAVLS